MIPKAPTTIADIYAAAELILEIPDHGDAVAFLCDQLGCSFSRGYVLMVTAATENPTSPLGLAYSKRGLAPIRLPEPPRGVLGPRSV